MSGFICKSCRAAIRAPKACTPVQSLRHKHSISEQPVDIASILSKPTWSVRSLLPVSRSTSLAEDSSSPSITPKQLHHLLRLSALPLPTSPEEEKLMLSTLESQLHFVRAIREVDTKGVEPLVAIRDETDEGITEFTIGLQDLKEALGNEESKGRNKRPRRKRDAVPVTKVDLEADEKWDVLGMAERKIGRYFVVGPPTEGEKHMLEQKEAKKQKQREDSDESKENRHISDGDLNSWNRQQGIGVKEGARNVGTVPKREDLAGTNVDFGLDMMRDVSEIAGTKIRKFFTSGPLTEEERRAMKQKKATAEQMLGENQKEKLNKQQMVELKEARELAAIARHGIDWWVKNTRSMGITRYGKEAWEQHIKKLVEKHNSLQNSSNQTK